MSPEFIMHIARQKMAAEPTLPASSRIESFTMADELWSICNILKMMDAGSSHQTSDCLFSTLLDWLERPSFKITMLPAPSELWCSHLTLTVSKYLLRYSASIFTNCSRFPYQEETINQWFTVFAEGVQRDKDVHIMNVDKDGQTKECYRAQDSIDSFPWSPEDDDFAEVFYHGTSHEGANNIMKFGIDIKKGDKKRDFSSGDGFYLGKNFDKAFGWTKTRGHPTSAVLVFRVNKVELRRTVKKRDGLDLTKPEGKKEWQTVVSQFRSGKPDDKFRKYLNKNHRFIEGPEASASSKNPRSEYPKQKDGTYQLCVRNVDCAELFDRSLHSVVFFDK